MAGRPLSLPQELLLRGERESFHAWDMRYTRRITLFPPIPRSRGAPSQTPARELGYRQQRRESTRPSNSQDDETMG